jgi:hypothetical protein
MAGIYLSKCEGDFGRRDFHLADRPLSEIAGRFGFGPEDREPTMPEHAGPENRLFVMVSVPEYEAEGTKFEAGYYRAAIDPHEALRDCGVGLAAILGQRGTSEPH